MNRFTIFISLGLITLPLYFFPSGGPQISHFLFLFLFLFLFFSNQSKIPYDQTTNLLFLFTFFIFLRESVDVIYFNSEITSLSFFIFTLFNALLFVFIVSYCLKFGVSNFIGYSLLFSVVIATISVLLISGLNFAYAPEGIERAVGTFNNPNQLGYYSVCIFSLFNLLLFSKKIKYLAWMVGISCSIFLCLASLSKAAMVSLILSLLVFAISIVNRKNIYVFVIFAALIGVVILRFALSVDWDDIIFIRRLQGIGQDSDDSLEGRGYNAILEANAIELIFGLGYQKTLNIVSHEVHSTFMSILINYGFIGFGLFLAFIIKLYKSTLNSYGFLKSIALFLPSLMYGLTHNGSRFTIFWCFLAFLYYLSLERTRFTQKSD